MLKDFFVGNIMGWDGANLETFKTQTDDQIIDLGGATI